MAKVAKDDEDIVFGLLSDVASEKITMPEARGILHSYVKSLTVSQQKEFRDSAVAKARRLMMVAEGFSQELTVIGSGQ